MSLASEYYESFWINCPSDILMLIFERLDINSLINCMHVNKTWSDTVYYYCQHYSLWGKMLEKSINKKCMTYEQKSDLNDQDLFLSAHNWLSVQNCKILPCYKYNADKIRSMCVFKGKLIVTSTLSVHFFDIGTKYLMKKFGNMCLDYIETTSLIVQLSLPNFEVIGYNILTVINKLHNKACECTEVKKIILFDICIFKVHLNACYVVDIKNILWVYIAEECCWDAKVLARYYGNKESILLIHVHNDDVYMLLKTGDIMKVDRKCKKFERLFSLDIPHYCLHKRLFLFHKYSILFAAPSDKTLDLFPSKETNQAIVACTGLTCVLEHGPVILTGYEDGMVKIFEIGKLLNKDIVPVLELRMQSYFTLQSYEIIAIDVYEDRDGHHLFVATENNICEILLKN